MSTRGYTEVGKQLAGAYIDTLAFKPSCFLVLRPSLGVRVESGACLLNKGEILDGVLIAHPVNAARKIIIRTEQGTFNINEEDVKKL